MYTIDEIKEYIAILENSSLSVLELQQGDGTKVRLEKPQQQLRQLVDAPIAPAAVAQSAATDSQTAAAPAETKTESAEGGKTINSPIVGVFYAAPSPESEPYAAVGSKIKKGDTICIIEAMKCMNEIQAEFDCEIVDILVKDGELVEYAQKLFSVK